MYNKEFGDYLRSLRKRKNLSIKELQELSGVSDAYISQIENGKNRFLRQKPWKNCTSISMCPLNNYWKKQVTSQRSNSILLSIYMTYCKNHLLLIRGSRCPQNSGNC
ncbi:helix-turn-helix transcriptional regulator [Geobacillus sp. 47C-IIb]|nr:helix-turn-helix transcriptional regulator [Geobacillus sp. 47C-IIb]